MTEKQLQKQIIEILNLTGHKVWMTNSGMIRTGENNRIVKVGFKGLSDIIGLRKSDGKFIAIEVKLPKRRKNVTIYQEQFIKSIKILGGLAGVATSAEEALQIIKGK